MNSTLKKKLSSLLDFDFFWLIFLLVLAGLIRFINLGKPPFQHDESIHAWFSYLLWQGHPYKYDPVYHGPFLYLTNALVYKFCGANDFSARLLPALFSVGLIGLCRSLKKYLGKTGWIVAAMFIALSPSFSYYGRFLGHDTYVAFFTLAIVVLGLKFTEQKSPRPLLLMGVVLGCFIATKACFYLHLAIFSSFFVFISAFDTFGPNLPRRVLWQRALSFIRAYRWTFLKAMILFLLVYTTLYSSLFTNWQGVWDGIYQTLSYWGGQQFNPRLPGPFYYYLPRLVLHEPVFYLAMPALFRIGMKKAASFDLFLAYWTLTTFFLYSFANEKVPWLLIHILLPMALLAGRQAQCIWKKKKNRVGLLVILALLFSWSLRDNLELLYFSPPASPHLLKYMSSSNDVKKAALIIKKYREKPGQVFITGQATWPLAWYLRGQPISYQLLNGWEKTAVLLVSDAAPKNTVPHFIPQRFLLQTWWLPDFRQLFSSELLPYLGCHEVQQSIGKSYFILSIKSDQNQSYTQTTKVKRGNP